MTIRRRLEALESMARSQIPREVRSDLDVARRIAFAINRCLHEGKALPAALVLAHRKVIGMPGNTGSDRRRRRKCAGLSAS